MNPTLLALTLLIGSDAARMSKRSMKSSGNRGTGLAPGSWKVDGGLSYLGATLADADIHLDCTSISDDVLVGDVLDSSIVNGSNVIPGGYTGLRMTYQRVNFGWFDNRNGYYIEQALCTVAGQCLQRAFIGENQNKLMVYANSPTLGLTVWVTTGNGASPRTAAQALIQTRASGNRGTGLAAGSWKVDGGLSYLGATLVDADINLDITSIDDNTLVANVLDSSVINGSNVLPGGYSGVRMNYERVNFGWFDNRNGYFVEQALCTVSGQCLQKAFVGENQNKLMVYANSPTLGLTVWVTSGNGASPRTAVADVGAQSIPLNVQDCGNGAIATLSGYSPTSVQQGQENLVNAWGTISEDVPGGLMNLNAAMTGFPWTNLGSISNHDICTPATLELRALGIWGGTIDFDGLACPVLQSQGEINLPIKLTLASALPGGMLNTRANITGTASNGKNLLCAAVTTSR